MPQFDSALPPGIAGWVASQQLTNQTNQANLGNLSGITGILAKLQEQQQAQQLRGAISSPEFASLPPEKQIAMLTRIPGGIAVAGQLAALQQHSAALKQAGNVEGFRNDVLSGKFNTPGAPAEPARSLPPDQAGPVNPYIPARAPGFDQNAMLRGAIAAAPDPIKAMSELRAENKPQFAPANATHMFLNGQLVPIAGAVPPNESPLAKLQREKAALPPNDPRHAQYDAAIQHATNPQAQRIIIPPQPLPVQTHTDASGQLWERERGGQWKKATGPDNTLITGKGAPSATGKEQVTNLVTGLYDAYDQLEKAGGITDPTKSAVTNVGAALGSSGVGQAVGRMVGTQNQSLRNSIAQTRPLLLNAIRQATGMSARQMDSNTELKLYLSAATDPTLDIAANRRALEMLDKLYGLGAGANGSPAKTGATGKWKVEKVTP